MSTSTGPTQPAKDAPQAAIRAPKPIADAPLAGTVPQSAKTRTIPKGVSLAEEPSAHPPATICLTAPMVAALPGGEFLAFASDCVDDIEKVRIACENRLRQFTRTEQDQDGETRGWGMTLDHPQLATNAALLKTIKHDSDVLTDIGYDTSVITRTGIRGCACLECQAVRNLQKLMREHPLGPWVQRTVGVGEKQCARLLAAIGDPYIRPEIARDDGTVEPSRPRTVSQLWAYTGYHVDKIPVNSHPPRDTHASSAVDGSDIPASQNENDTHWGVAGGEVNGHPSHRELDIHVDAAGVAVKRRKGQRANWSATAKMRAYLIAESCIKQHNSPYRTIYDNDRTNNANATHQHPCERCGPKNHPAPPGTPLSDGHKHARALRKVAKELLKHLWQEAKRVHDTPN